MENIYFNSSHTYYRTQLGVFIQEHIAPHIAQWELEEHIPKYIWIELMHFINDLKKGTKGKVMKNPGSYFYDVVLIEELAKLNYAGFAASYGICQLAKPYLENYGSEYIKRTYLDQIKNGEFWCSIAITEPSGGSDVAQLKTLALEFDDHFLINGSKTFITNGVYADFYLLAVKIKALDVEHMSLIIVDASSDGITKTKIPKMGWHCSDTATIGFQNVRVPKKNLVGNQGFGFQYLMEHLQNERLYVAVMAVADMDDMYSYTRRTLTSKHHVLNPYQLIELSKVYAEIQVFKNYVYHCCAIFDAGIYAVKECTIAKKSTSEALIKLINKCMDLLQFSSVDEKNEIARKFRDARISTIGGGTSDIMSEILSKIVLDQKAYTQVIS